MQKIKCININPFKYIPYISDDAIKSQLDPNNHEGIIIESYGAGNLPNNRKVLTKCLTDLMNSKVVVINVSQFRKGLMSADYAVGKQLEALGIIYGGDLTFESAQAKLTYLMSKGYNKLEIKNLFCKSIRGELTEIKSDNLIDNEIQPLLKLKILLGKEACTEDELDFSINNELVPMILNKLAKENNLPKLLLILQELGSTVSEINRQERIDTANLNSQINDSNENGVNKKNTPKPINIKYNNLIKAYPLHIAAENGNLEICETLIDYGFNVNGLDDNRKSVIFYACKSQNEVLVDHLLNMDVNINLKDVDGAFICELAKLNKTEAIKLFYKVYQNLVFSKDFDKRNLSHIAAIKNNIELFKFLIEKVDFPFYRDKDIIGKSAYDYASNEIKELLNK